MIVALHQQLLAVFLPPQNSFSLLNCITFVIFILLIISRGGFEAKQSLSIPLFSRHTEGCPISVPRNIIHKLSSILKSVRDSMPIKEPLKAFYSCLQGQRANTGKNRYGLDGVKEKASAKPLFCRCLFYDNP